MKNRYTLRTVAALLTAVAAFSFTPAHAAVDCTATPNGPWQVANATDLNAAIVCFNAKAPVNATDYTINLTANVVLSSSSTTISNTTANAKLIINGDGNKIDGQNTTGVRPITIAENTTVTIDSITITRGQTANSGNTDAKSGGGILNKGTLTNSTVSNNQAHSLGGGIYDKGTLTLINSTVSGNQATLDGSGIYSNNGTLTLTNSTVSGNTANDDGGGIYSRTSTLTLINSTVSGNTSSSGNGGGINNDHTLTLTNSIIANSTGGDCKNGFSGFVTAANNNLIESTGADACNITGNNIIGQDPKLGNLADNGGATFTHALLAGSQAFNAGVTVAGVTTDQRGISRPQGDKPDMGAYEARLFTLSVDVDTSNMTGTGIIS